MIGGKATKSGHKSNSLLTMPSTASLNSSMGLRDVGSQFAVLLSSIYFLVINVIFDLLFVFRQKKIVPSSTNEILQWSAVETAKRIRQGKVSVSEVLETYIARVEQVNPSLNAIVSKNYEQAWEMAKECDQYLTTVNGDAEALLELENSKPLFGLPFTLKDLYPLAGHKVTFGLTWKKDNIETINCSWVDKLISKGAIPLGLTNVPETGLHWDTYNYVYGKTINPYDSRRNTAGSSGGEGAIMAAQGTCVSIGSDAGGSIRMPSACCGLFGLKPTALAVKSSPAYLVSGYRESIHCIGPMARHACDLKFVFENLCDDDVLPRLRLDVPVDLKKLRVFVMNELRSTKIEGLHEEPRAALSKAVKHLQSDYGITPTPVDFARINHGGNLFFGVFDLGNPKFERLETAMEPREWNVVSEIGKALIGKSEHMLGVLMQVFIEKYLYSENNNKYYQHEADLLRSELAATLGDDGVMFMPTMAHLALYHGQADWKIFNISYTCFANVIGFPAIAIPMGIDKKSGLPTSVQVVASPHNERLLIAIANEFEQAFGGFIPPGSA